MIHIRHLKTWMSILTMMSLLFIISPNSSLAETDSQIVVDEPTFIQNNRAYVPIRFVSQDMGGKIKWDGETATATVQAANGDIFAFKVNSKKVKINNEDYFMDVRPIMTDGRVYLPVRHISELLHARVSIINDQIIANRIPEHEVQRGETLGKIASEYGTTVKLLKARNGLKGNELIAGSTLKVVIPQFMKKQPNVELLAKLIQAEAQGEPFKGKVAVGNVVVNRIQSDKFPDTLKGVIYQPNQFTPVKTGRINSIVPSQDSIRAAERALSGAKPVKNALFFFNPSLTNSVYLHSKPAIAKIGNQQFAK